MTADGQGEVGGGVDHRRLPPPDCVPQRVPRVRVPQRTLPRRLRPLILPAELTLVEGGLHPLGRLAVDAGLDPVLLLHMGGGGGGGGGVGGHQAYFTVH